MIKCHMILSVLKLVWHITSAIDLDFGFWVLEKSSHGMINIQETKLAPTNTCSGCHAQYWACSSCIATGRWIEKGKELKKKNNPSHMLLEKKKSKKEFCYYGNSGI